MAIAVVANTAKATVDTNNVTTDAIDTTGASLIVLLVSYYGTAGIAVSDSKGNTWNVLTVRSIGNQSSAVFYYAVNPTVGSGHTFTITTTTKFPSVCVLAVSGANTSSPFDVENGNSASNSTTVSTNSVTPNTDDQIVVAGLTNFPAGTDTINGGFTISDQIAYVTGVSMGSAMAYLIQTSATAANPTWTHSATMTEAVAAIATFEAAAAPPGGGQSSIAAFASRTQTQGYGILVNH